MLVSRLLFGALVQALSITNLIIIEHVPIHSGVPPIADHACQHVKQVKLLYLENED
jgi:hypothetical protein